MKTLIEWLVESYEALPSSQGQPALPPDFVLFSHALIQKEFCPPYDHERLRLLTEADGNLLLVHTSQSGEELLTLALRPSVLAEPQPDLSPEALNIGKVSEVGQQPRPVLSAAVQRENVRQMSTGPIDHSTLPPGQIERIQQMQDRNRDRQ